MSLSANMIAAINMQETGEVFLPLVRLSHADWPADERIARNNEDVTHNGEVYEARSFEITLPDQDADGIPVLQWRIEAVSLELVQLLRSAPSEVDAFVFYVMASSPDIVELAYELKINTSEYDDSSVGGPMSIEPILDEQFGYMTMTPSTTPAIF